MKQPNIAIEVFMSIVKWFLIVLLVNNIIWLGVLYTIVENSSSETTLNQDGENNMQGVNNGTIN